jgi:hypothetical protein
MRRGAILLLCATAAQPAWAINDLQAGGTRDLTEMSLEELMNEPVTSVSKKEQKLSQVAAAIFVINQEDIRRSGALDIPDLLRMVPGLDIAQINANTWAISARGFNHQFSDKLLVLIDGRAVYQPTSGGVNWDTQDVPLEDMSDRRSQLLGSRRRPMPGDIVCQTSTQAPNRERNAHHRNTRSLHRASRRECTRGSLRGILHSRVLYAGEPVASENWA